MTGSLDVPAGVVGVGIDVVAVQRFADALHRTPALAARLFTEVELRTGSGARRTATSLAARFAAKEAVAKALGVPRGMDWHHCVISTLPSGQPELTVTDTVARAAAERGVTGWRLSLSHDAGIAAAVVMALGVPVLDTP
ncbi:holo-ACP synthase [Nakamurella silvestris]|nr:holo-ACP synthase [Nakamurella silvestris]